MSNWYYSFDTDAFSAVCAYYNGDRFFTMLADMGFSFGPNSDFPTIPMPLPINHWGNDLTGPPYYQSGLGAAAVGTSSGLPLGVSLSRIVNLSQNPNLLFLGNGTSYRMLLHEFSHIFLMDRLNSGNFPFAHSFGDSLAAILSDPYSQLPDWPEQIYDRYATFPWDFSINTQYHNLARRHRRHVAGPSATSGTAPFYLDSGGWYWGGHWDTGGYFSEQILSSTFFDAYRALGWVAVNFSGPTFEFASRLMILLIMKTLKNLSPSGTPPYNNTPQLAMDFCEDIIAFDKGIQGNFPNSILYGNTSIPTGGSHKVIRWAFERRGAYHFAPQVPPYTNYNPDAFPGPPVDIFIYKGGITPGEYGVVPDFWSSPDIFNRNQADGSLSTPHQNPAPNATNYVYLKIRSRGQAWPASFVAKLYSCGPGGGNVWPNDWNSFSSPAEIVHQVSGNPAEILIGPFQWTAPGAFAHVCILATVSTVEITSSGYNLTEDDMANTETISGIIPTWHLVPTDNNIAQRNMTALPAMSGSLSIASAIAGLGFFVRNPFNSDLEVSLVAVLPPVLADREWVLEFSTGTDVPLEAFDRDGVEVNMIFIEGTPFSREDVLETDDRQIVIYMKTYYLDPDYDG